MELGFKEFPQINEVEQVDVAAERYKDVDIAPLALLSTDIGTKQAEALHAITRHDLRLAVPDYVDDFLFAHDRVIP